MPSEIAIVDQLVSVDWGAAAVCVATLSLAGGLTASRKWLRRRVGGSDQIRVMAVLAVVFVVPVAALCALAPTSTWHLWAERALHIGGWSIVGMVSIALAVGRLATLRCQTETGWRVLAIGAHPDDPELGCGASLARWVDAGADVHVLVLSHGENGGNGSARPGEAERAAAFIGASSVDVLGFPDSRLPTAGPELVGAIEKAIERVRPQLILTHSANDTHQDHQAVHEATVRAARRHSSVLCYESPSATHAFQPTFFVDIADYVDAKVAAVAAHRDQGAKPYMAEERVRAQAVYRGGQAKVSHAEGYEPVRMLLPETAAFA